MNKEVFTTYRKTVQGFDLNAEKTVSDSEARVVLILKTVRLQKL
jgi:hypothetical protein